MLSSFRMKPVWLIVALVFALPIGFFSFVGFLGGSDFNDSEYSDAEKAQLASVNEAKGGANTVEVAPLNFQGLPGAEWSESSLVSDSIELEDWPRSLIVADIGPIIDADADEVDRPLARVGSIGRPIDADDEAAEALRHHRITGSIGEPLSADDDLAERVITGRTGNIGEPIDVESLLQ